MYMVILVFLKRFLWFLITIPFLILFLFRALYVFLYFLVVDLRLGLYSIFSKPLPWCLYKLDEVFIFQGLQFVRGVILPILKLLWRDFWLSQPTSKLLYLMRRCIRYFLFWYYFREQFYNFIYIILHDNWHWLVWVSLLSIVTICLFCIGPAFFRAYEDSIDLSRMYDIETDTFLNLVAFMYYCSLPLYMGLASIVATFLLGIFIATADIGALFISFCELSWAFLVFLSWCTFRAFGYELRKVDVSVWYTFLLCVFHCLFFYIFLAEIYLFADDIVSTCEFFGDISMRQEALIDNSYLGVIGSYAVVILYYMRVCNVWGEYFDTRVFRVFLLVYFAWGNIPTKYWFSFLAPV